MDCAPRDVPSGEDGAVGGESISEMDRYILAVRHDPTSWGKLSFSLYTYIRSDLKKLPQGACQAQVREEGQLSPRRARTRATEETLVELR